MVRHSVFRWTVAILALSWARPASAASLVAPTGAAVSPLFVSGNVEADMPANSSGVTVVPGQAFNAVAQPQWMTDAGLKNGYVMKDLRLSYDKQTDTLSVGINYYGVAGNTDGSPNGQTDPRTTAAGGANYPHLGGDKSVTVAFTPVSKDGAAAQPLIVAGVPAVKTSSPTGSLDGFNVASYQPNAGGLGRSYGTTLTQNLGALAYDPSAMHPGFEFTIKNFSKIPGLNALTNGFYVSAYTGTGSTTIIGKSYLSNTLVGPPAPQSISNLLPPPTVNVPTPPIITPPTPPIPHVTTPEPTTILAWGLVMGGAAWRVRRRIGVPAQS